MQICISNMRERERERERDAIFKKTTGTDSFQILTSYLSLSSYLLI